MRVRRETAFSHFVTCGMRPRHARSRLRDGQTTSMLKGSGASIRSLCEAILGGRRSYDVGRSAERLKASKPFAGAGAGMCSWVPTTRPRGAAGW